MVQLFSNHMDKKHWVYLLLLFETKYYHHHYGISKRLAKSFSKIKFDYC